MPTRPDRRDRRSTTAASVLTWIAFGMVPVVTVVELAGPRVLSLTLRVVWLCVVGTLVALVLTRRRVRPALAPRR